MNILVLNNGSSSIKFQILVVGQVVSLETQPRNALKPSLRGSVKHIGEQATLELEWEGKAVIRLKRNVRNHREGLSWIFEELAGDKYVKHGARLIDHVEAIGHRVVHGGTRFRESTVISSEVMEEIEALSELAPLHNPICLEGIKFARERFGTQKPMIAVFDTAFYRNLPDNARWYALPFELARRHHIERYGFHGIAHASLVEGYQLYTRRQAMNDRMITLQLGNGCSMTAVAGGQAVETSMGFTPLEGLVMGTRSGDLDPSIVNFLVEKEKLSPAEIERLFNTQSGLLGVSGISHDMKQILEAVENTQDTHAALAVDLFCHRAKKYLGAYLAVLGGAESVVFGGGIGEASPDIRARICGNMEWCGIKLDSERNQAAVGLLPGDAARISSKDSLIDVLVVAADEESWIAKETARLLSPHS